MDPEDLLGAEYTDKLVKELSKLYALSKDGDILDLLTSVGSVKKVKNAVMQKDINKQQHEIDILTKKLEMVSIKYNIVRRFLYKLGYDLGLAGKTKDELTDFANENYLRSIDSKEGTPDFNKFDRGMEFIDE